MAAGRRELAGVVEEGEEYSGWEKSGAKTQLGTLLEGMSWQAGWWQEGNVGGGRRLAAEEKLDGMLKGGSWQGSCLGGGM